MIMGSALRIFVGKAQLEAQSTTSETSTIAEGALRFNFLFLQH